MKNYLTSYDPFFDILFPTLPFEDVDSKMMQSIVMEKKDHYEIMINMPGIERKNIKLSLKDNYLTVTATYEDTSRDEFDFFFHQAVSGSYSKSFKVPNGVKEKDISASFEDDVLTVIVNKIHKEKCKEDKD